MAVSVELRQKIINLLTAIPNISDSEVRQALIQSAGLDPQLQNQISSVSSPGPFFQLLLSTLVQYGRLHDGRHAVAAILEVTKSALSKEGREYCNGLIRELGEIPLAEDSDAALSSTLFADIVQHNPNTGGSTVNVTFGNGAHVKGFTIGDDNVIATDVKSEGDFVQNRDGHVEIHKATQADSQVATKEDLLQVLQQMKELIAGIELESRRTKKALNDELEEAVLEIEEPADGKKPDKQTITEHLQRAAETLKATGATAIQTMAFGQLVGQAATWLGPHADTLLKMFGL